MQVAVAELQTLVLMVQEVKAVVVQEQALMELLTLAAVAVVTEARLQVAQVAQVS
jgi:hypothetical protein